MVEKGNRIDAVAIQRAYTGAAWLSSARVVRCWVNGEHSGETAIDKMEEGGDDVKSSWPLCLGRHTCYNGWYKGQRVREDKRIPKSQSQFGLQSATRLHEVGIASNRGSAKPR